MEDDQKRYNALLQQHDQVVRMISDFYEWRHKILTRYAIVLAALGVAAGWVNRSIRLEDRREVLLVLIGALVVASVVALLMDCATQNVLRELYDVGTSIEMRLGEEGRSTFFGYASLVARL